METLPHARMVIKPLICASLLAWYISRLPKQHSLMILGLTMAVAGDVLLLFETDLFFKLGLLAFLVMQLCYIGYLRQFKDKILGPTQKYLIGIVAICLLGFISAGFYYTIDALYLVLIYALVLGYMAYTAIQFPRLDKSISIIGIGAFLFMISDLILAINKFFTPFILAPYLIMITYMIAQFLIVKGIGDDAVHYFKVKALKESQITNKRK